MLVEIFNFRGITERKLEVPEIGTILLKGRNGVGKSTTFRAIEWCLYGKGTCLRNFSGGKERPKVHIKIGGLDITRSAYPDDLHIFFEGKKYDGNEGQPLINKIYGNKELWNSCSYLSQDSFHVLTSGSSSARFELIHDLAFNSQDSLDIISKISSKELVLSREILKEEGKKEHMTSLLSNLPNIEIIYDNIEDCLENKEKLRILMIDSDKSLKETKLKYHKIKEDIARKTTLIKQKEDTSESLLKLEKETRNINFTEIYERIIQDERELKIVDQILSISGKLSSVGNNNILEKFFNEKSLCEFLIKWKSFVKVFWDKNIYQIEKGLKQHQSFLVWKRDLSHNRDIELKILQAEKHNEQIKINKEIKSLKNKLEDSQIKARMKDKNINEEIRKIEDRLSEYTCPCCKVSLLIEDNVLTKGTLKNEDDRKDMEKERTLLIEYANTRKMFDSIKGKERTMDNEEEISIETLNKELRILPPSPPASFLKEELPDLLVDDLKNIKIEKEVYKEKNFSLLYKLLECKELYDKREKLLLLKTRSKEDINREIIKNKKLYSKNNEINVYKDVIESISEKLKNYNNDEENLSEKEIEIEEMEEKKLSLQKEIKIANDNEEMLKLKSSLQKSQENIQKINVKLASLEKLNKIANNLIFESMKEITESIQFQTNRILETIYEGEEPMKIELLTEKTSKDGKKTKNLINLKILNKGILYSDIKDLSGGELSILSFALVLGLSKTSNSKLLILDESFKSIDMEKRDNCMEAIKIYLDDKCVMFVLHDTDVNMYDKVIDFG